MLASVVELIVLEKSDDSYSLKLHNLLKLLFDKSYTTLKQVDEIKVTVFICVVVEIVIA